MHVLLDEERVSLRPRDDVVHRTVGATRQERARQLLRFGHIERLERYRHRVRTSGTPARSSLEEVRAREAEEEKRRMQLFQELLEQREKWLFRPVQILEHDRSWRGAEARFEVSRHPEGELAPASVGRQLRLRRVGVGESERRELARDRTGLELVKALHTRDAV